MTTLFLVRHSEPFKEHKGIEDVNETLFFNNIKTPLSVNGEKIADEISNNDIFKDLDVVWSSDYVRTMSTAKYFALKNNLKVNISDKLGERKHGVNSWSELPENFEEIQFLDENFKVGTGESQKDTKEREYNFLMKLLEEYENKKILIVGHSTAFAFLLSYWCKISYDGEYYFNEIPFFDGKWKVCETFKLTFDKEKLIDIENIRW